MEKQRPRFRLEDLAKKTPENARISSRAYIKPYEEISRERTFDCSCDIDCQCYGQPAC